MSKVITFSRMFPSYHPRSGEETNFVEKIWKGLGGVSSEYTTQFIGEDFKKSIVWGYQLVEGVKHHTIRAGHRFKAGDWFSPRVWGNDINPKSGRSGPYHSKQIIIAPDIQVKKVWDFDYMPTLWIDESTFKINDKNVSLDLINTCATNDGLSLVDFAYWFGGGMMASSTRTPFTGQIICWNKNINY